MNLINRILSDTVMKLIIYNIIIIIVVGIAIDFYTVFTGAFLWY